MWKTFICGHCWPTPRFEYSPEQLKVWPIYDHYGTVFGHPTPLGTPLLLTSLKALKSDPVNHIMLRAFRRTPYDICFEQPFLPISWPLKATACGKWIVHNLCRVGLIWKTFRRYSQFGRSLSMQSLILFVWLTNLLFIRLTTFELSFLPKHSFDRRTDLSFLLSWQQGLVQQAKRTIWSEVLNFVAYAFLILSKRGVAEIKFHLTESGFLLWDRL